MIVDGHGCHTSLHFGVKAKENQDKVPSLYWLPKPIKNHTKQDLLLILVLVRPLSFVKSISTVFNYNKLVTEVDIENSIPDS